jgi:multiple sugar transport system permease protein
VAQRAAVSEEPYATGSKLMRLSGLALLWLLLAVILFPFVEMLSTSLKSKPDLSAFPPVWFPAAPVLRNYLDLWSAIPLADYLRNSLVIAVGATALNAAVAVPGGYALARFRFPGRQLVLYCVVATQMFSPVVLLLATFRMMFSFGLLNTYWSVIFVDATVALPFTI